MNRFIIITLFVLFSFSVLAGPYLAIPQTGKQKQSVLVDAEEKEETDQIEKEDFNSNETLNSNPTTVGSAITVNNLGYLISREEKVPVSFCISPETPPPDSI